MNFRAMCGIDNEDAATSTGLLYLPPNPQYHSTHERPSVSQTLARILIPCISTRLKAIMLVVAS